jgi:hypothetical protein
VTPEQIKYFDEMELMFGLPGWKHFIEDIQMRQTQDKENLLNSKQTASDIQTMYGRNEVYAYALSLESVLEEVKRQLQEVEHE